MNKRTQQKLDKITQLFTLASSGQSRPKIGTPLGNALTNYTGENSRCFDPAFTAQIKAQRPDWFGRGDAVRTRDTTTPEDAMEAMIAMALNHETLDVSHKWYHRLRRYTNPESLYYSEDFTKLIMLLAPHWSDRLAERRRIGDAETNKRALLMVAEAGWDRPSRQTKLGQVLSTYVSVNHTSYDGIFLSRLMSLRSDWFGYGVTAKAA